METLKTIRALLGFTSQELGDYLGVSRQTISSIENGRSKFTKTYKLALMYLFNNGYFSEVPAKRVELAREFLIESMK